MLEMKNPASGMPEILLMLNSKMSFSAFDLHQLKELLALGERIGHVSTGLSEDLISKCLTETIYYSSEPSQGEGNCVICLEEYKNMDDVGTLKSCGHDYHVSCIRKWFIGNYRKNTRLLIFLSDF